MYLEIVGKLASAGISRIHGHEDTAFHILSSIKVINLIAGIWKDTQVDFLAIKLESLQACVHGMLDCLDLRTDHRQNFCLNTVELIKASPSNNISGCVFSFYVLLCC